MRRRTLLASIVCGLSAIAVQSMSAVAATLPSLVGSWQFTLTPTTPVSPVVPIPGLATFTKDGSVIETDGSEFVPIPSTMVAVRASTPGHGIWQPGPVPGALYVQYISLVLEADGALFARNITTMTLTMNTKGNQFTGTYTTDQEIGTLIIILSTGTVSGQLIPHLPLP